MERGNDEGADRFRDRDRDLFLDCTNASDHDKGLQVDEGPQARDATEPYACVVIPMLPVFDMAACCVRVH